MADYVASVRWERGTDTGFTAGRYRRKHEWLFDGGARVPASASPQHVPLPYADAAGVDPEEALVAAASSCHMLFVLYFASQRGLAIASYTDDAVGSMSKDANGREYIGQIILRPNIVFDGDKRPVQSEVDALHHDAHEHCYIANSVKTEIVVRGTARGIG